MRIVIFSNSSVNSSAVQEEIKHISSEKNRKNLKFLATLDNTEIVVCDANFKQEDIKKKKIDIAFVLYDTNKIDSIIKEIKTNHPDCFVVYIYNSDDLSKHYLDIGADDIAPITTFIDNKHNYKIKLWLEVANTRTEYILNMSGKNAINIRIWNRVTKFYISDEGSLALMWEFFINDKRFEKLVYANHWIQACYSVCLKLIEKNYKPVVSFEENDEQYFLTISSLPIGNRAFYEELVEYAQLDKMRFISHTHKKSKGVFSLHFLKDLHLDEEDVVLVKTITNKTEQTSDATVYVPLKNPSMALDSAKDYVKECGIEIDDLQELHSLESDIKDELAILDEPI
ncbi:MAG: hypothetical protein RL154_1441 [Pseudomonadota bacterium]